MAELNVVRWRKFGMDRLYVNTADGVRVGWVDLVTGKETLKVEEHRLGFAEAIQSHRDDCSSERGVEHPQPDQDEVEGVESSSLIEPVMPDLPQAPPPGPDRPPGQSAPGPTCRGIAPARRFGSRPSPCSGRRHCEPGLTGPSGRRPTSGHGASAPRARPWWLRRWPSSPSTSWKFLHAVPVGERGSDIDHVAIGAQGVYTINAKHHPGAKVWVGGNTVLVNGTKTWYVGNTRHEAQRATRLLSAAAGFPVLVTGLVVVVNAQSFEVKSQPPGGDVQVVYRKQLVNWLQRRGGVLSPDQVSSIFEVARRSTTWS